MGEYKIDLNCDLGELSDGAALDAAVIPHITSANVACGFHAGGPAEMAHTVAIAKLCGAAVGAHPGFGDRANFGRTEMELPAEELQSMLLYQLGALSAICRCADVRVTYVKPHGALYNMAARDKALAMALCQAVAAFDPGLILLGLSGSKLIEAARECGLRAAGEVFADRGYRGDGSLVPRKEKNAVLTDMDAIILRTVRMAKDGLVQAVDGSWVEVQADSVCLHGDNPGAAAFAAGVRAALEAEGVRVEPLGL